MSKKGMTTMAVRQINRNRVYSMIYQDVTTSKAQLVQELQMGLSTVSQNLKTLEEEGLIERKGFFDSTGGRKAQAIRIVPEARIAIGIGILQEMFHIAAIDLYGNLVYDETLPLIYEQDNSYYRKVGESLKNFIDKHNILPSSVLGVSIATQGIVSPDHASIYYGTLMGNSKMQVSDFTRYIPYPCRLEHDSKAAANLELWNRKDIENAVFLLLNRNFGGAVITGRQVQQGVHMQSGILEHLCLNPDGPLCYCGSRGCLETYCSANALKIKSGMDIPVFFDNLRNNNLQCVNIWQEFLEHLAFALRNLCVVIDGTIIMSGYLAPYLLEEDILYLLEKINAAAPFSLSREQVAIGAQGQYAPAIGAALYYVEKFLKSI